MLQEMAELEARRERVKLNVARRCFPHCYYVDSCCIKFMILGTLFLETREVLK